MKTRIFHYLFENNLTQILFFTFKFYCCHIVRIVRIVLLENNEKNYIIYKKHCYRCEYQIQFCFSNNVNLRLLKSNT